MKVTGWPVATLSRGELVWDGKSPRGKPGRGRFLRCDRPQMARPKSMAPDAARTATTPHKLEEHTT